MHVDIAKKIYKDKLNANFPKIRFTYIKLTRNFCKQYVRLTLFYANLLQYKRREGNRRTREYRNRETG